MPALRHLAIIMDGNGRWAKAHGKPRVAGHRAGAETLDRVAALCRKAGIEYLTVYAFSTENWKRPKAEVSALMRLLSTFARTKRETMLREGIRFRAIGRLSDLSPRLRREICDLEKATAAGRFTLAVALCYGGRDEILRASLKMAEDLRSRPAGFHPDESYFRGFLDAPDIPDPDLVIRTSGECRTSNFLMWETAYSEWFFTPVLWPDFGEKEFREALESYAGRERRMGGRPA